MRLLITTQIVDKDDPMLGFFHAWIAEFAKHCESIEVIALKEGRHELPHNVRVHSLGKERGVGRIGYILNFYRYIWSLRSRYDAVFVHMNPEYVVLGGLLWRLWGKRIGLWYTHKAVQMKLHLALVLVHVVCTASAESFRIVSPKVHVVGHGIDTALFSGGERKPSTHLRILTVGRVTPAKRIKEMIAVVAELRRQNSDVVLTIAGTPVSASDVAYQSAARVYAENLGVADAVVWAGAVLPQRMPEFYKNTDVFLNLSDTGSLDKAVLEALLSGIPTVSSNDAFRDMIGDLFVGEESPTAIGAAVMRAHGGDVAEITKLVQQRHALASLIPRLLNLLS